MATTRRPANAPKFESKTHNPFDSDDSDSGECERGKVLAPPATAASRTSSAPLPSSKYSNPFGDNDGGEDEALKNGAVRHPHRKSDGESARGGNKGEGSLMNPLNPFDASGDDTQGVSSSAAAYNPFDSAGERGDNVSKDKNLNRKGFGDAALKRVQKLKESSASGAQKLKEGSLNHVHRLKEGASNTFGSNTDRGFHSKIPTTATSLPIKKATVVDEEWARESLFDSYPNPAPARVQYSDADFRSNEAMEGRTMQELEGYAMQKSEETTNSIQNSLRIAENIREDATKTLITLHNQGDQIRRTHELAADIDHDLSRKRINRVQNCMCIAENNKEDTTKMLITLHNQGDQIRRTRELTADINHNLNRGEKLLGNLGGLFSKTWKPKKAHQITGPTITKNDSFKRRGHHLEQRVALGLNTKAGGRAQKGGDSSSFGQAENDDQSVLAKLQTEKAKQDDSLDDLSNVLGQLKEMSLDMGSEISRQNETLDPFQDDVIELGERVKGANMRTRRLLGK